MPVSAVAKGPFQLASGMKDCETMHLLATKACEQFEHFFSRFFTEQRKHVDEALDDGPEALDQDIRHWIAETGACGAAIHDFWAALNDPVASALTSFINLRTRESF